MDARERLRQFLEQRIVHQMLGETLLQFETRELQQLDRLLQLRRHDQFLAEPKIEAKFHWMRHAVRG